MNTLIDPSRCPFCGAPNGCLLAAGESSNARCWCATKQFPLELLARVPAPARQRACICQCCLERESTKSTHGSISLITDPIPKPAALGRHQVRRTFAIETRPANLERAIESKRALLAYLRSKPEHMTMESYVCLTDILRKANWHYASDQWQKDNLRFSALEAAKVELDHQIATERDQLLHQTVKNYQSSAA